MTSRERVLAVLQGQTPDRVPVAEMFIDPTVIHALCPGMSYEDFIDHADMDIVTCLTMADDPEDIEWMDRDQGTWRDKWGASQRITADVMSRVIPPARIESEADLASYEPPDPSTASVVRYARKLVDRFKGKRAIAVVGEGSFAPSQYLRAGLENLMVDFVLRPEFVKKLAKVCVEYHVELYRKLISEGVEIVVLGDDYGSKSGPIMSPAHFEQYVLPGLKTIVGAVHESGGYCLHHTDGDVWKIMDLLIDSGLDGLGPLEPAYMRLDEVRRYSSGKLTVVGNVDIDLLSRGSVEEVKAATRELMDRMLPVGGHILSSGNTISSYVKPENFMAMLETARSFS